MNRYQQVSMNRYQQVRTLCLLPHHAPIFWLCRGRWQSGLLSFVERNGMCVIVACLGGRPYTVAPQNVRTPEQQALTEEQRQAAQDAEERERQKWYAEHVAIDFPNG